MGIISWQIYKNHNLIKQLEPNHARYFNIKVITSYIHILNLLHHTQKTKIVVYHILLITMFQFTSCYNFYHILTLKIHNTKYSLRIQLKYWLAANKNGPIIVISNNSIGLVDMWATWKYDTTQIKWSTKLLKHCANNYLAWVTLHENEKYNN